MKVKYSRFRHNAKQTSFTSPTGPRRQGGEQEHAQYPTNDDVTSGWSCLRPENVSILSSLVVTLKRPPPFSPKVPVNTARTLMCTGHWSWNVLNAFGTITTRFVLYAITRFPRGEITWKRAFFGVTIAEQLHTKTWRRWKPISIPLLKLSGERRWRLINFHPLQIAVYLILLFLIKSLKRYLVSDFITSNY